jgi:hypothetical protein
VVERERENKDTLPRDSCVNFEAELAAYLEGEECPGLLSHASHCDFCRCVLSDIQQIRTISSGIELEDPPAVVWTRVRSALVAEGIIKMPPGFRPRWAPGRVARLFRAPMPVAALAAAIIAAVVLLKAPKHQGHAPVARAVRTAVVQEYMAPAEVAELKRTIQQLELAYDANESLLEPSMKATYRKSLDSLNDEIRECESSIQQDPQDGLARQYLSTAYAQKAQLLQSALEFDLR